MCPRLWVARGLKGLHLGRFFRRRGDEVTSFLAGRRHTRHLRRDRPLAPNAKRPPRKLEMNGGTKLAWKQQQQQPKFLRANPLERAGGENLAKSEKSETDLNEGGAEPRWMLARAAQVTAGGHCLLMGVANANLCMRASSSLG